MKTIAEKLRFHAARAGLNNSQIAKQCRENCSHMTVYRVMTGQTKAVPVPVLAAIARAIGLNSEQVGRMVLGK